MKIDWSIVGGILLLLFSAAFMIGLIMWTVDVAFGDTAGLITLKAYRALPASTKSALVAGAMAATEHVGMRCPDPQLSVGEYVSTLNFRASLDESKPWIAHYFDLVMAKGCVVEEDRTLPSLVGPTS